MRHRFFGLFVMILISCASTAAGQLSIAPGSEYTLTQDAATGGSAGDNGNITFTRNSEFSLTAKTIKAEVSGGLSIGTGSANAQIYYDFQVPASPGTSGNSVGAWVSYSTAWQGVQMILATLLSNASVDVDLMLRDMTEGRNLRIEPIHALDLKTHTYKFITAGLNFDDSGSKGSTFPAVLKRGNSYRVTLRMSCTLMVISTSPTASICDYMDAGGGGGGSGRVQLNSLYVKVGLDEREVLQKLAESQNHRHIYLTGHGVGHNNTQALSSTPTTVKSDVEVRTSPVMESPEQDLPPTPESPPEPRR